MTDAGHFQQLAGDFTEATEAYLKTNDATSLERLRRLRLQIVEALLDLPATANQQVIAHSLPSIVASCVRSGVRGIPRSPAENEIFVRCLDGLTPWSPDKAPAQGIPALLLAWHAFELDFVPPIASIPAAVIPSWVGFLCENPPAFAKSGDADKFALYLRKLSERFSDYLTHADDHAAEIIEAFNGSLIFVQIYFNELNVCDVMRARGTIIENFLERHEAVLDQMRVIQPIRTRPRIGFIAFGLGDGTETVFLAANMEHLDRSRYEVRLFSLDDTVSKVGTRCRASADTYTCLPRNIHQAVARLRSEDLDLAIFCTNLTASNHSLT